MKLPVVISAAITVLAALVAVVAFVSQPASVTASDGRSQISAAESSFEFNSDNTENVYQQQVVALWAIRDLSEVQAEQNATLINSQVAVLERQSRLLAWGQASTVLLVLLIGLTAMWGVFIGRHFTREGQSGMGSEGSPDTTSTATQEH